MGEFPLPQKCKGWLEIVHTIKWQVTPPGSARPPLPKTVATYTVCWSVGVLQSWRQGHVRSCAKYSDSRHWIIWACLKTMTKEKYILNIVFVPIVREVVLHYRGSTLINLTIDSESTQIIGKYKPCNQNWIQWTTGGEMIRNTAKSWSNGV